MFHLFFLGGESMEKLERRKGIICIGILLIIYLLYGNSNENPIPYITRLCHWGKTGQSTFCWENIILFIVICIVLNKLGDIQQLQPLKNFLVKIIVIAITFSLFEGINVGIIKGYKHLRNDLHALYLEREEMKLEWENGRLSNGYITLTNCSSKDKKFYIEVSYHERQNNGMEIERKITFDQLYNIAGGDTMRLQLVEPIEDAYEETSGKSVSWHDRSSFEVRLFNELESVTFLENI